MRHTLMLCLAVTALSFSAAGVGMAQDAAPDSDLAKRIELAKEMHKIRSARMQVQEAIDQVGRNLPPLDRDRFTKMVEKAFDYDALEKLSIDTMVELFTTQELQKMVDYFGSAEARSIEKKLPVYQEKIQPYIIKSLDSAMIADRTGNAPAPETLPAAPTDAKDTGTKAETPKKSTP